MYQQMHYSFAVVIIIYHVAVLPLLVLRQGLQRSYTDKVAKWQPLFNQEL